MPLLMRSEPVLCAVTDRRRLARIAGLPEQDEDACRDALLDFVREAASADLDLLIQIREPDLSTTRLYDLVAGAVSIVRARTRILVNDRLDVALAAGAHGVHLRASSVDAARARAHAPAHFLIGRSVHALDEAVAAEAAGGLDYLILGTVFPTTSKPPRYVVAGLETLRATVAACRLPILGIGGVTLDNARDVARTGAAGIAAIGLFMEGRGQLRERVARVARQFRGSDDDRRDC